MDMIMDFILIYQWTCLWILYYLFYGNLEVFHVGMCYNQIYVLERAFWQ